MQGPDFSFPAPAIANEYQLNRTEKRKEKEKGKKGALGWRKKYPSGHKLLRNSVQHLAISFSQSERALHGVTGVSAWVVWNGGFALWALSLSNRHTPPVLSLSIFSAIGLASFSNVGHGRGTRLKNRRCHSRPSACSFFRSSRWAFSILLFSMPTVSMSVLLIAAATCCHAL